MGCWLFIFPFVFPAQHNIYPFIFPAIIPIQSNCWYLYLFFYFLLVLLNDKVSVLLLSLTCIYFSLAKSKEVYEQIQETVNVLFLLLPVGLSRWLSGKESACQAGNTTPGLGRSPGEENGNPLLYCCLGNPMDRGDWWATGHRIMKELDMPEWLNNKNLSCYNFWDKMVLKFLSFNSFFLT